MTLTHTIRASGGRGYDKPGTGHLAQDETVGLDRRPHGHGCPRAALSDPGRVRLGARGPRGRRPDCREAHDPRRAGQGRQSVRRHAIDGIASWADDYRRDHPETGPWHYIDIPLADSKIDMERDCPEGQFVIAQTERFLSVRRDPSADKAARAEALKFVVHFVGDLHQPLHDEDNDDKGGNGRHVIFDGKPDNLHWVWDTGLLEHINRNPQALAAELESKITPQKRAEWDKGSVEIGPWRGTGSLRRSHTATWAAGIQRRSPPRTSSRRTRRLRNSWRKPG